jgi:hypothetical protein
VSIGVARYNRYMFEVNLLGCSGQEVAFIFSAADSVDTRDLACGGHVGCCERICEPLKVKVRNLPKSKTAVSGIWKCYGRRHDLSISIPHVSGVRSS